MALNGLANLKRSLSAKLNLIAAGSWRGIGRMFRVMTISELSQPTLFSETELPLTRSAAGFRAKTLAMLANGLALKVRDLVCGRNTPVSLASYDPASSSWKTSQACLVSGWEPYSETFPRSGMMLSGTVYQLQPLAPLTGETACGLWLTPQTGDGRACLTGTQNQLMLAHQVMQWPTPTVDSATTRSSRYAQGGMPLTMAVQIWPTPTQRIWKGGGQAMTRPDGKSRMDMLDWAVEHQSGGRLSPMWVEWLMGFPLGWTDLKPSETQSFPKSPNSSDAP